MYISVRLCFLFLFSASGDHRDLHSFPTRRSSDLNRMCLACTSMDALDHDILRHLQENGRMSNLDLARAIGLSPTPTLRRVRALERCGAIRGYRAMIDPEAIQRSFQVFVSVDLVQGTRGNIEAYER